MSLPNYKPKWPRRSYLGPAGDAQALREAARKQSAATKPKTRQIASQTPRKASRRRSPRMTKLMAQYRKQKAVFLAKFPTCAVFPCRQGSLITRRATEVHHMRGRQGSLLLDERFWLPVSSEGHRWIHDNPDKARRMGYLCAKGSWNQSSRLIARTASNL